MAGVMDAIKESLFQKESLKIDKETQKANLAILKEVEKSLPVIRDYVAWNANMTAQIGLNDEIFRNQLLMYTIEGNTALAALDDAIIEIEDMTDEEIAANQQLQLTMQSAADSLDLVVDTSVEQQKALVALNDTQTAIVDRLDEQIETQQEAKIHDLVGKDSETKVLPQESEKSEEKSSFDMNMFMGGLGKILKTLLNPVAMVVAFVAEFLPWILIFGAVLIGFLKKASLKTLLHLVWIFTKYIAIPVAAALLAIKALKLAGMLFWTAAQTAVKQSKAYIWATEKYKRAQAWLTEKIKRVLNLEFLKKKEIKDDAARNFEKNQGIIKRAKSWAAEAWHWTQEKVKQAWSWMQEKAKWLRDKLYDAWKWTKAKASWAAKKAYAAWQWAMAKKDAVLNKIRNSKIFKSTMTNIKWEARQQKKFFKAQFALQKRKLKDFKSNSLFNKLFNRKKMVNETVEHTTKMGNEGKSFMFTIKEHLTKIGNEIRKLVMSVARHIMKVANIVKEFLMSVATHIKELALVAYKVVLAIAEFIKSLIPIAIKIVQAIIVFIADLARIVIQIAMTAAQYILIVLAVIAIVAIIAGLIYLVIQAVEKVWPMIKEFLASLWDFIGGIFEKIADVVGSLFGSIAETVGSVIDGLLDAVFGIMESLWEWVSTAIFEPIKIFFGFLSTCAVKVIDVIGDVLLSLMNPFAMIIKAVKALFADDEENEKKEAKADSSTDMSPGMENVQADFFTAFCENVNRQLSDIADFNKNIAKQNSDSVFAAASTSTTNNTMGFTTLQVSSLNVSDSVKMENAETDNSSTSNVAMAGGEDYTPEDDLHLLHKDLQELLKAFKSGDWS